MGRKLMLEGAELGRAIGDVLRTHRGRGDRVGFVRATMRDLGDDLLAGALVEDGEALVVGRLTDGTYAAVLAPTTPKRLDRFACRVADETSRRAREAGLPPVQTLSVGVFGSRAWPTVGAFLERSEAALGVMRQMAAYEGVGPPRAAA